MAFLATLLVVYLVGAFVPKMVVGPAASPNWAWPLQVGKKLYDKITGYKPSDPTDSAGA